MKNRDVLELISIMRVSLANLVEIVSNVCLSEWHRIRRMMTMDEKQRMIEKIEYRLRNSKNDKLATGDWWDGYRKALEDVLKQVFNKEQNQKV